MYKMKKQTNLQLNNVNKKEFVIENCFKDN